MRVTYVGKKTELVGKTLWEILGNLKNCGVGRLIKRHAFDRYPEPSFYRIVKVDTFPPEVDIEDRRVRVWVENVFRGQRYPELMPLYAVTFKPDYRLIPKSEEKDYWERVYATPPKMKLLPEYTSFPPLLAEMIKEEMRKNGQPVEEPKLKLKIKNGRDNFYRLVGEGESPTVQIDLPPDPDSEYYKIK